VTTLYSISVFECVEVRGDPALSGFRSMKFKSKSDGAEVLFLVNIEDEAPEVGGVYLLNAVALRPQKGK
jgi:hypothetical protein